jgi:hypothetical protein
VLTISHSKFLESSKVGRFILTLSCNAYLNNSVWSNSIEKTAPSDYQFMGGTDSLTSSESNANELYIGSYKNFITPVVKAQIIYFPPDSHVGMNFSMEQNIGSYNALNGIMGIPIVLIDKEGHPAANFQFQFRFFDITNKILSNKNFFDKTSVGLTVGVPFSKIIY